MKGRYKNIAPLEIAPWYFRGIPYGAIGTKKSPIPCPCLFPWPCPFPCIVSFHFVSMCFRCMALWIFLADTAIILSIPKGPMRWRGNLKGLSNKRGWLNSTENLGASPFKRDVSIDTTFQPNKSHWTVPLNNKRCYFCVMWHSPENSFPSLLTMEKDKIRGWKIDQCSQYW